jgi:hypothetical protein
MTVDEVVRSVLSVSGETYVLLREEHTGMVFLIQTLTENFIVETIRGNVRPPTLTRYAGLVNENKNRAAAT